MSAVAGTLPELRFRAAVEARDPSAVVEAFTPDAVLHSPNTGKLAIKGREQIAALYEVIFEVFEDLRFTDELRGDGSAVLLARARVDGTDIEIADHVRLDEDGRVRELTVFFRPMPAIAVATRALGAALAGRKSPRRGKIVSLLATPLVAQTRIVDRFSDRMVGPGLE